jgi:hypothetical protein
MGLQRFAILFRKCNGPQVMVEIMCFRDGSTKQKS